MEKHIVIIGAVAAGPKAASRLRRLDPHARITMIDEGEFISFGGCGIPYYVSGEVQQLDALRTTGYGVVRDPAFFKKFKNITVLNATRAESIDRAARTVRLRNLATGETGSLSYDRLVLATGSTPKIPPIAGRDLGNVSTATSLEAARLLREACATGKVTRAVIVGGGFIGLEMAVALADMWGIATTVVEYMDQLLPGAVSPDMADMVRHDMESGMVSVFTSEKVQRLEGNAAGNVARVITDKRVLEADLVLFATGFAPNTALAQNAGLQVDKATGGIAVNERMETSDPAIYAGGDCVAVRHLVTGKPACFPLGSLANRQGRVIGTNLAGGNAVFKGATGTWAVKLFKLSVCGVGLTEARARAADFDAITVHAEQLDRAHFYPEKAMMGLDLVVDKATRRVLGLQGVCEDGDAVKARIDAVATMFQLGVPTVDDISNAEVAYAPPFSAALDTLNTLGNVADNVLSGLLQPMKSSEFTDLWADRAKNNVYFVDCRPAKASETLAETYPDEWHPLPLEQAVADDAALDAIPKDRPVALTCNVGLRAYEVMLLLRQRGITNVRNALGGMQAIQRRGVKL